MARKLVAEGLGTFVLVSFAVGSAGGGINVIGDAGVVFAVGLVLLALVCASGPCRVVTSTVPEQWLFIVAPLVGGVIAAGVSSFLRSKSKPLEPGLKAEA